MTTDQPQLSPDPATAVPEPSRPVIPAPAGERTPAGSGQPEQGPAGPSEPDMGAAGPSEPDMGAAGPSESVAGAAVPSGAALSAAGPGAPGAPVPGEEAGAAEPSGPGPGAATPSEAGDLSATAGRGAKAGRKRRKWFGRGVAPAEADLAETTADKIDPSAAGPAKVESPSTDPAEGKAAASTGDKSAEAASETANTSDKPAEAASDTASTGDKPAEATDKAADAEDAVVAGRGWRKKAKRLPTARPEGAPPDPWTAFATTPERPPGLIRRAARFAGRCLIHEYALVVYASLVLAAALTWPTLHYPLHTVAQDIYDPSRQAWQVAWAGHALLTDPAMLWQSNTFFPADYSFAYGDSLLGYAPAGLLGHGPLAAVLRYNLLYVLAHALLLIGGYALIRQLGTGRTGATVGAAAFALAPWWLAQQGHLDIISAGGIPLALAMLARGHGWSMRYGFRAGRRHLGWTAAGWLLSAWQISLGFSLGLPFAYALGLILVFLLIAVPIRWLRKKRPTLGWRLILADVLGALFVAGVGGVIAIPYLRSGGNGSAHAEIDFFSPPLRALLIGPAESRIWGAAHQVPRSTLGWPAEMTLLPGFVLYALALVGLVFSIWSWWQRLALVLGLAAATILTLGSTFFDGRWTYFPLFGHLSDAFGVRIPGRLMIWVTLLLAILAGGAVAELVRRSEQLAAQRMPPWPSPWMRIATLIPLVLILVESWGATAHPVTPVQPAAMRVVATPTLVLPTSTLSDESTMLWTTTRFQKVANGGGTSFAAVRQSDLRQAAATFPDQSSVAYLRGVGVDTVILLRSAAVGTPWERAGDVPVDTLGIQREDLDNNTVLFRLN